MHVIKSQRIYFPANDEHVIVNLLPNGRYEAYREDDVDDEGRVEFTGDGNTVLSAIASLNEELEANDAG